MVTTQAGLVPLTLMNWPTLRSTESRFGLAFMVGHATFLEAHAGGSGQASCEAGDSDNQAHNRWLALPHKQSLLAA
jgi:hypothetical protein